MGSIMSKKAIYKITVTNWDKYNSKKKKGHECIMLSTDFFDDAKVRVLSSGGKLLFLGLLLRCGEVASRSVEGTHDLLVRLAGGNGQVVQRLMDQLQSLQLLTYEKTEPLILIEEKRREEKRIVEAKASTSPTAEKPAAARKINKPKVLTLKVETVQHLADCITKPVWENWQLSFSDDYIQDEMAKAVLWLLNNPKANHKTPLGISRFMTGWLTRGWDKFLKKQPARQKQPEFNL
jgi:hypothetical protein